MVPVPQLLPVTVAPEPQRHGAPGHPHDIEIEFSGALLRVRDGVSARTLRAVLDAPRDLPR